MNHTGRSIPDFPSDRITGRHDGLRPHRQAERQTKEGGMKRIALTLAAILLLVGNGLAMAEAPFDAAEEMVQVASRQGIINRILIYRPEKPIANIILFPDGNGRLDITHVFNDPYMGRLEDVPLDLIGHLLEQKMTVVLMDAPSDHRSVLGVNGWHGPGIFRLSDDHARDIGAVVHHLKQTSSLPVWLAGIRMGAFSAATAAIFLQNEITGLVLAGGITHCPEQKILLQLCPHGLMGLPLHDITVPTLILTEDYAFPEPVLSSALVHSPTIRFQTFPEFVDFESRNGWDLSQAAIPGVSNAHISREMAHFIRWNEMYNPVLIVDNADRAMASLEAYLVGVYY
jgi:pimeloyl-ACP methyl ester carboxylesterase